MLQSLERRAGLPIALDPVSQRIAWAGDIVGGELEERSFAEMQPFISEADARPTSDPIYRVWRKLARRADAERIETAGLRYDLTLIPPGLFIASRREFFRTAGHYHAREPGAGIGYPEVYEVLAGRAYWLIQRPGPDNPATLEEIYLVEAGPGEKALIPPGFGHITINAFGEPLVVANWIYGAFAYAYDPFRELRGGGYWLLEGSIPNTIESVANPHYRSQPPLTKIRPREIPRLGLERAKPLYTLADTLEILRFLREPHEFVSHLSVEACYRHISKS